MSKARSMRWNMPQPSSETSNCRCIAVCRIDTVTCVPPLWSMALFSSSVKACCAMRATGGQGEVRREVARPGQVFLQAGELVALHHLAQRSGLVDRLAADAFAHQPLRGFQSVQQRMSGAAAQRLALHHVAGQMLAMLADGRGDPLGGGDQVRTCHRNALTGASRRMSVPVSARPEAAEAQ
jgi:hypothetical protein